MKIFAYKYNFIANKSMEEMGGNQGYCDFNKLQIKVASDIDEGMKCGVVLYEIMEAINYHLALGLQENQIMGLEVGLHQTLTENGVDLSPLLDEAKGESLWRSQQKV